MSHPIRKIDSHVDLRVIYGDTDQMGVVYYANYLRWFEASRGQYLRDAGIAYSEVERLGVAFPVIEAYAKYARPARYEDVVRVTPTIEYLKRVSLRFAYRVTRGEDLLAEGFTVHACIDGEGRPRRFPDELLRLLVA